MGVYVYALAAPSKRRKLHLLDGSSVDFVTMDFYCRSGYEEPAYANNETDRRRRQCYLNGLERKREAWEGTQGDLYVAVIHEKAEAGDEVYRWSGEINPVWYDCDKMPGELVGYLHQEGRKWYLVSDTNPMMVLAKAAATEED